MQLKAESSSELVIDHSPVLPCVGNAVPAAAFAQKLSTIFIFPFAEDGLTLKDPLLARYGGICSDTTLL